MVFSRSLTTGGTWMLISSVPVGQSTCKQCQNSWSQNSTLKIQTIMHNMRKWPECCFLFGNKVRSIPHNIDLQAYWLAKIHNEEWGCTVCENCWWVWSLSPHIVYKWSQNSMRKIQFEDAQSVKRVQMGLIHLSSLRSRRLSRSDAQCVKMEGIELVVDELGHKV